MSRFQFIRCTKSWRLWAFGWSDCRVPMSHGGSHRIVTVAVGPLRLQFSDMAKRWNPQSEG